MGDMARLRGLAMTDTIIIESPITIAPWPPRQVFNPEQLAELEAQGLAWEEPPLRELGSDFAPYTHVIRLTGPSNLSDAWALAEFDLA